MKQNQIYFKFIPDNYILNNEPTNFAKNNWLKYNHICSKNCNYISYLMKKYFAGSNEIKYNEYKKPIIDNGFFNISHDKNLCVGIYDDKHAIGIDVIAIDRHFHHPNLYKKIFNDNESKDIFQFSRKEAYIKMVGKGISRMKLLDIKIVDGKIYYKDRMEPYNIFEKIFNNYFVCVVGTFNSTDFIFTEFQIQKSLIN